MPNIELTRIVLVLQVFTQNISKLNTKMVSSMNWNLWIFLDIDGVLATNRTYSDWMKHREDWRLIDQRLLANVKDLLTTYPNHKLILSSSWRANADTTKALAKAFKAGGVPIWCAKTRLPQTWRSCEIYEFCIENVPVTDRILILDDMPMNEPEGTESLVQWHIKTKHSSGFNRSALRKAKMIVDQEIQYKEGMLNTDWPDDWTFIRP